MATTYSSALHYNNYAGAYNIVLHEPEPSNHHFPIATTNKIIHQMIDSDFLEKNKLKKKINRLGW